MRKLLGIAAGTALFISGTANAALVAVPTTMRLSIDIQNIGIIATSGVATVSVDTVTGAIFVPAGGLVLGTTVNLPVTATTAVVSVIGKVGVDQLAGTFSLGNVTANTPAEICPVGVTPRACIGGGGVNGPMALSGTVSVNLGGGVTIPINLGAALVGVGGTTTQPPVTGFFFENGVWTTGVAVVNFTTTTTTTSFVMGTTFSMMNSGVPQAPSSAGTAMGTMTPTPIVTLVTPTFVLPLGFLRQPVFAKLSIGMVPEPDTLLLLGSAIAGLALLCLRRIK